jgi:hypothetical protein
MASASHYSSKRPAAPGLCLHMGRKLAVVVGYLLILAQVARPATCVKSSAPNERSEDAGPTVETIRYDSGGTMITAILAKPEGNGKHPSIILIHDSQGLTAEFRNLAQQLAAAGFVTLAPDLLTRVGGTQTAQQAEAATAALRPQSTVEYWVRMGRVAKLQTRGNVAGTSACGNLLRGHSNRWVRERPCFRTCQLRPIRFLRYGEFDLDGRHVEEIRFEVRLLHLPENISRVLRPGKSELRF